MFSVVSVSSYGGGPHVTTNHDAIDTTPTPLQGPQTVWPTTCSNLFIWTSPYRHPPPEPVGTGQLALS